MTDDDTIIHAADLAERLVAEVSAPQQDWHLIARVALELVAIAGRAAREAADADGPR